jgi:hypothetical protein
MDAKALALAREIIAEGSYAGEGYWRTTCGALLNEVEWMRALLGIILRSTCIDEHRECPPFTHAMGVFGDDALRRDESSRTANQPCLRALLREVEWGGPFGGCHFCDGHQPDAGETPGTIMVDESTGRQTWRVGHAPDCRLAAAITTR